MLRKRAEDSIGGKTSVCQNPAQWHVATTAIPAKTRISLEMHMGTPVAQQRGRATNQEE
jgi:hypothetical protein